MKIYTKLLIVLLLSSTLVMGCDSSKVDSDAVTSAAQGGVENTESTKQTYQEILDEYKIASKDITETSIKEFNEETKNKDLADDKVGEIHNDKIEKLFEVMNNTLIEIDNLRIATNGPENEAEDWAASVHQVYMENLVDFQEGINN